MAVLEHLKAEKVEYKLVSGGREALTTCESCAGKEPKLYINIETGFFICHRCSRRGRIGSDPVDRPALAKEPTGNLSRSFVMAMHNMLSMYIGSEALSYLIGRGLTQETINRYKLGYHPGKDAISIPNIEMDNPDSDALAIKYRYIGDEDTLPRYTQESLGGRAQLPFNIGNIPKQGDAIHITEGELDAISLSQLFPDEPVIAVPGMHSFPRDNKSESGAWLSLIDEFRRVYLYPDNEIRAKIAFHRASAVIGKTRTRVIDLPYNDINSCLIKGMDAQAFKYLQQDAARGEGRPFVYSKEVFPETCKFLSEQSTQRRVSTGLAGLDKALDGLRPGELTLVAGDPKSGKSTIAFQVAYSTLTQAMPSLICSLEMPIRDNIEPRMLSLAHGINYFKQPDLLETAKHPKQFDRLVYLNPDDRQANVAVIESGLDSIYRMKKLERFPFVLMLIDNLTNFKIPPQLKGSERFEHQGETVASIKEFTRKYPNIHIILLCHLRKRGAGESPSKGDIRGSVQIQSECDNIIIVSRAKADKDNAVIQTDGVRSLSAPQNSEVTVRYDINTARVYEIEDQNSMRDEVM